MKKRVPFCKIICLFVSALTALTLVLALSSEAPLPGTRLAIHILLLLAAACALVYVFSGARKADARWLSSFEMLLALSVFLSIFRSLQLGHDIYGTALYVLSFGSICILIAAKDLGKERSFACCALFVLCQMGAVAIQSADQFSLTRLLGIFAHALMAILLQMLLELKYIDKAKRKAAGSQA